MTDARQPRSRSSLVAAAASVLWLGLIVAAVASVVRAFWFAPDFAAADATRGWPTVSGEVMVSDPERVKPTAGSLSGADFDFLQYRYSVGGMTYTNNRLQWVYTYQANETAHQFARRWATRYPTGTTVLVYYSAADPSVSVIEPGADRSGAMTAGLVLCVFLLATALVGLYFIHAAVAFWGRHRDRG